MIDRSIANRSGRFAGLLIRAALLGCVTGTAFAQAPGDSATPNREAAAYAPVKLDRARIDALLAVPDSVLFIDVRRADEISAIGGLPVFLNVQLPELDRFLAYIPRDRQIVTVSNHANRAIRAGALLAAKGFKVAGAIGVQDYSAEGGALYGRKVVTPAIPGVVAADTPVEVLREGFDGTEGPLALADGSLLFTETRADRIIRITPDGTVSTYLDKAGHPNALALSGKDELYAVQTDPVAIAVLRPKTRVIAGGKQFKRFNDLALARSGDIYASDPGPAPQPGAVAARTGFYRIDRRGRVTLVADDIRRPNGVALSPDEKTLYVANTGGEFLIAFTVQPDGSLAARRDFAKLAGFRQTPSGPTSGADGIVVDREGRVFVATSAGIEVFAADGAALGVIPLSKQPQNLAFAGTDHSHLYAVGRGSVFRIATQTRGVDRPGK